MADRFEVRIMDEFTPEFLQAARALYLENRWINENDDPAFPGNAFANSFVVVAAFSATGELAGVGRSISDGVSDAYIQDIMTAKKFRKQGVGKLVTMTIAEELKKRNIDWIGIVGVPGTEMFYAGCGLRCAPGHTLWLGGKE
ncbi:MAG: GNAT family N-acetyltransferase [Lentisphaeria bacterium]|nr:GNAT family N-acetyltransferase [Lentisphaeria bacterium]